MSPVPRRAITLPVLLAALGAFAPLTGCKRASSAGEAKQRPAPSVVVRQGGRPRRAGRGARARRSAAARAGRRRLEDARLRRRGAGRPRRRGEEGPAPRAGAAQRSARPALRRAQQLGQTKASAALARTNHERAEQARAVGRGHPAGAAAATAALASAEAAEASQQAQIAGMAMRLGETRITRPSTASSRRGASIPARWSARRRRRHRSPWCASTGCACSSPLNERDAVGISVGKDAHVELDALPGRDFTGKVVRVAPVVRSTDAHARRRGPARQRVGRAAPGHVRPRRHPQSGPPDAPVVPVSAVRTSSGKSYVFVLRDTRVEERAITTGVEVDGGQASRSVPASWRARRWSSPAPTAWPTAPRSASRATSIRIPASPGRRPSHPEAGPGGPTSA